MEEHSERFHKQLTDVSQYSLSGLCAVSLVQLFQEECHTDFKMKALEKILLDLGQSKQTNDSMIALLDGEIIDNTDTFVDNLLKDPELKQSRLPLVRDLLCISIAQGTYDARMRTLIRHVAWQLRVSDEELQDLESDLAESLEYEVYVMTEEEQKEKEKKARKRKIKRYALIGLATVGGGALIGLTGGLAAPLVAAGAGAIIGGAGAAVLGSTAGVAIIGSLFGVAGAGLTGYKMKKRVGAIEEFAFEPLTLLGSKYDPTRTVKQLNITIAVTGWLNEKVQDFRIPWSCLIESKEQYSLRWETKYVRQMGEAMDYLMSIGINMATTEALKYTILSGLITAVAWPSALLSASATIDNPWHVCTSRATQTGKQLAEVLLAREQGNRPVTLIGFSLGARVIFSCLEELSKRTGGEGLVEEVILLGAPVSGDVKLWKPLERIVSGKIVNGYSRSDWLLKFLFRTASVTFNVAGLSPVKWDNRRMHNIDLSEVIDGHGDYLKKLNEVMRAVGLKTKDQLESAFENFSLTSKKKSPSPSKSPPNSSSADLIAGETRNDLKVNNEAKGDTLEKSSSENSIENGSIETAEEVVENNNVKKGDDTDVGSNVGDCSPVPSKRKFNDIKTIARKVGEKIRPPKPESRVCFGADDESVKISDEERLQQKNVRHKKAAAMTEDDEFCSFTDSDPPTDDDDSEKWEEKEVKA
ncbi:transmembrane and coiled-coil domain-containing protein 4-like isoform X3 [Dreissena polymorpha]|uniref:transmembrane and coiled-coil domain-containing protein 4-like isoform X3 n=1 Tax=Dreissena polymorpha TaxID=45954 RepID=UPI002264E65A|nr:transmembrane and coiled-coil domain-containing protein 4-like isoform X3 [Dreissena polymorpha]